MADRVLVVDDEPQILRALAINLRARGYDVDLAPSGEEALRLAADHHPDVVILDLGLPGISGIEAIQGLRGWSCVPIIILSAREAEADKTAALDAGGEGGPGPRRAPPLHHRAGDGLPLRTMIGANSDRTHRRLTDSEPNLWP